MSVLQNVSIVECVFPFFLHLPLTTEAMGIWRFAGAFAVVERQSECGSKAAEMHSLSRFIGVSQPMNIGVCCTKTPYTGSALISLLSDIYNTYSLKFSFQVAEWENLDLLP